MTHDFTFENKCGCLLFQPSIFCRYSMSEHPEGEFEERGPFVMQNGTSWNIIHWLPDGFFFLFLIYLFWNGIWQDLYNSFLRNLSWCCGWRGTLRGNDSHVAWMGHYRKGMIDTLEWKPSVSVRWILNIEVKLNLINNFFEILTAPWPWM